MPLGVVQPPVHELNDVPAGISSVIVTPVAIPLPVLPYVSVYVIVSPPTTLVLLAVLAIVRFDVAVTLTVVSSDGSSGSSPVSRTADVLDRRRAGRERRRRA